MIPSPDSSLQKPAHPLPADQPKREEIVSFREDATNKKALEARAKLEGTTVSALLRQWVDRGLGEAFCKNINSNPRPPQNRRGDTDVPHS